LGVNAERFNALELADKIFRLALEMDPDNSGVMQQFASYIIDNRSDLYPEAQQLLDELQTGRHAGHRPLRRLRLQAQLAVAQGQELDPARVEELANAAQTETNPQELGVILDTLTISGEYERAYQIFRDSVSRFENVKARYTLQRLTADALYRRPEPKNEFIAMDLYRQILTYPEVGDPNDLPRIMTAYATVLDKHGYPAEAGCLYFHAYIHPQGRNNSAFLRNYALYMQKAGRLDLAEKILDRQDIDEMALVESNEELPEQFSEGELPNALSNGETRPLFECLAETTNASSATAPEV
jgi:Tfp pilus assembly protein PilF